MMGEAGKAAGTVMTSLLVDQKIVMIGEALGNSDT